MARLRSRERIVGRTKVKALGAQARITDSYKGQYTSAVIPLENPADKALIRIWRDTETVLIDTRPLATMVTAKLTVCQDTRRRVSELLARCPSIELVVIDYWVKANDVTAHRAPMLPIVTIPQDIAERMALDSRQGQRIDTLLVKVTGSAGDLQLARLWPCVQLVEITCPHVGRNDKGLGIAKASIGKALVNSLPKAKVKAKAFPKPYRSRPTGSPMVVGGRDKMGRMIDSAIVYIT